jgi:prophage maintenance system killer protein
MGGAIPEMLTVQDVINIHEVLVEDFVRSGDTISPPGVKSMAMLESAVARQSVGHGGNLKYGDPLSSASTLTYGICCNHPFHNGNKRTALVALLVHLDRNKRTIYGADQRDLYSLLLSVAGHTMDGQTESHDGRRDSDGEVTAISAWLKRRTRIIDRSERLITFRRLRQCLRRFGYELRGISDNRLEVGKWGEQRVGLLRIRTESVWLRCGVIGYRDEGTEVSIKDLKAVRRMCSLTEDNGIDSDSFYDDVAVVDAFVNRYRTLLRRLGKT